jgi:2-polyprenyl-3-methyl-5-hydroxy-6-metoxy-1,4-benzoquinol methylase
VGPSQTCPNCSHANVRSVFTSSYNRVVECGGCRLQFADTYPDHEDADADIYTYDYFSDAIEHQPERRGVLEELLTELESVVRRKGRLLDIGAGEGTLLLTAASRGWEVEGTDISSAMVRHVRENLGLTLHHGAIEDLALPGNSFDAVVLNHVLEHVRNPRTTLEEVSRLLRDESVVRIEVPNLASLSSRFKNAQSRLRLKRSPWKHYSTDHHFWFFTPTTLKWTLEKAGLALISLRAPSQQWGRPSLVQRVGNHLYRRTMWGGHLVAYATRRKTG